MKQRPRIGLVGLGYWGMNLLRNLLASERADITGAADLLEEPRRRCTTLYPHVPTFPSLDALLAKGRPDAMVIAVPPHEHCDVAVRCLGQGMHVLVEKPLASSVKECDRILQAASQAERTVMVDHTFLFHPAVEYLNAMIRRGDFGKLLYYDSVRVNFGKFQAPTDVLWDLGPHDLSILDLFLDGQEPVHVSAEAAEHLGTGVSNVCYVTLRYASGTIAHLHLNWMAPIKVRTIMVGGSRKMAIYDDNLPAEKVKIYDKEVVLLNSQDVARRVGYRVGDMIAPALSNDEALLRMIHHFLDCIAAGRTPVSDGAAGRRVVRVLELATRSAALGGQQLALGEGA